MSNAERYHHATLRLVVDNSSMSDAETAPDVTSEIRRNWSGRGKRRPLLHRLTVVRSTPTIAAKSSSESSLADSHSSIVMTDNVPYRHNRRKRFCASLAGDDPAGRCQHGGMKNRLRILRNERRLTQTEVAARLGCAHTTVGRLETGRRALRGEWIYRFAKLYEVNPAELFDYPASQDDIDAEFQALRDELSPEQWRAILATARSLLSAEPKTPPIPAKRKRTA